MCLTNNEPHCGSEARLTALDKETVEGNIEFDEQNPEVITALPIEPEPEVCEWFLCIRQQHFMLAGTFTATEREILQIHFNCPYVHALHLVQFLIQTNHCTTYILTIYLSLIVLQVF